MSSRLICSDRIRTTEAPSSGSGPIDARSAKTAKRLLLVKANSGGAASTAGGGGGMVSMLAPRCAGVRFGLTLSAYPMLKRPG